MAYAFRDGTPYDGPVITLPDGRILSGETFTANSQRLMEVEDGGQRSGELHETSPTEEVVQQSKGRSKGRKAGQWSARKAQRLALLYKKAGGGYTS